MSFISNIALLVAACFNIFLIASIFSPAKGGFWLKYLNIEPTRAHSILGNLILVTVFGTIFGISAPDEYAYRNGMEALEKKEYQTAIQNFSSIKSGSKHYQDKESLIAQAKKDAKTYYEKAIRNSYVLLDEQKTSSLIDKMKQVTGETPIEKEKVKSIIDDEALKQRNQMRQSQRAGNFEEAKQYATRLQKIDKYKNEATKVIVLCDKFLEKKKAEEAARKAEEEMTKQLQARSQAEEAAFQAERQARKKAEEDEAALQAFARSQVGFYSQMKRFKEAYNDAPNEIKKSEIFNQARNYEKHFFANVEDVVQNWKGRLSIIGTNKGGSSLSLSVKTGDNSFFGCDIYFTEGYGMFDGITPSSNIYHQASEFKEGDCIIFSGEVDPKESSLTESGAMRSPTYEIHFTDLRQCPK